MSIIKKLETAFTPSARPTQCKAAFITFPVELFAPATEVSTIPLLKRPFNALRNAAAEERLIFLITPFENSYSFSGIFAKTMTKTTYGIMECGLQKRHVDVQMSSIQIIDDSFPLTALYNLLSLVINGAPIISDKAR